MIGDRSSTATAPRRPDPAYAPGYAQVGTSVGAAAPVTAIPASMSPVTAIPAQAVDGEWPTWHQQPDDYWPPEQPRRARSHRLRLVLFAVVLVIVAPLTGIAILIAILQSQPLAQAPQSTAATAPNPRAPGGFRSGAAVAPQRGPIDPAAVSAAVQPAVVNVDATLGFQGAQAAGTGVVLDQSGVILTNNHVIAGATSLTVTEGASGRTHPASVVGYDRSHDIAVLQLANVTGLRPISFGNSATVAVGDGVVALGNAGGAGGAPTIVAGAITGLDRSITATDADGGTPERLTGLIEVSADIRPGDSGGPLVDRTGRLIGINTAASAGSGTQVADRRGFAIPTNVALAIAQQIRSGAASTTVHLGQTALLGVQTQDAAGRGGRQVADGSPTGAAVTGVVPGSPAQRAGVAPGDVIVSFGGRTIESAADLTTAVDGRHPGDQVEVGWIDGNGRARTATVRMLNGPAG